jgi:CubicO group peptidase (beta-lactamase class C family)
MDDGLHIGAQLYVSLHGRVVGDIAIGESLAGVPMRPGTVMRWLSAGKPVAAVAVAQLVEGGLARYDDAVARHVPEFAAHGKQAITVRHVLTHTGGFRSAEPAAALPTWEERVAAVCAAPNEPDWRPGERAGYHPASGWIILGEVIRRLTGLPFEDYVRRNIFEPIGMGDSWASASPDLVYRYGDRWGELHITEGGQRAVHPAHSTQSSGYVCRPGSTLRGPARELGRFYEMLLNGGATGDARVLSGSSVREITSRQRTGMYDETFKHVMDWGLGFIVNSRRYGAGVPYGFGPHATDGAFGHGGSQSSVAFADPAHGLVVSAVFNGLPGEARHDRRVKRVTAAVYEDLGLVG